jgi:lipoprotein LprG
MTSTQHLRLRPLATTLVWPMLLLGACSGGDDEEPVTPEDALAGAKTKLDETSGVSLSLTTDQLPDGVDALSEATGVGTHAPAFEGDITVIYNGLSVEVPVIAVDGRVFAKVFTTDYKEIEPDDYGAPDPAMLMDPTEGISSWLTDVEDVEAGDQTREGDAVLTTYTGTLPGSAVAGVIPSASKNADFDATFGIDDDGYLVTAEVGGPFYGDAGVVDYTIGLDDYGVDKDITRP